MKKVSVDMYHQEVMVFLGKKDIHKWLKKHPVEDFEELSGQIEMSSGLAGVLFTQEGEGSFFVYLEDKNLATLTHECGHLTFMILSMVGIEFDANNHEAFTYLQEFIFSKVAEVLKIPIEFE